MYGLITVSVRVGRLSTSVSKLYNCYILGAFRKLTNGNSLISPLTLRQAFARENVSFLVMTKKGAYKAHSSTNE